MVIYENLLPSDFDVKLKINAFLENAEIDLDSEAINALLNFIERNVGFNEGCDPYYEVIKKHPYF
jgi:hypothetical protein